MELRYAPSAALWQEAEGTSRQHLSLVTADGKSPSELAQPPSPSHGRAWFLKSAPPLIFLLANQGKCAIPRSRHPSAGGCLPKDRGELIWDGWGQEHNLPSFPSHVPPPSQPEASFLRDKKRRAKSENTQLSMIRLGFAGGNPRRTRKANVPARGVLHVAPSLACLQPGGVGGGSLGTRGGRGKTAAIK